MSVLSHFKRRLAGWSQIVIPGLLAAFVLNNGEAIAQPVIQQASGAHYIAWEAQDGEFMNGDDATGWIMVDNDPDSDATVVMPHEQLGEASIALPQNTNASQGNAVLDQVGGGNTDWINYQLEFAEPGTYHLYAHFSMFDRTDVSSYGNEDSIFFPRAFGISPAGPRGDNNFWASTPANPELSMLPGDSTFENGQMEGNFHWWRVEQQGPEDGVDSDLKVVSDAELGQVLEFGMAAREAGTSIDKLVMSTRDDLTAEELNELVVFDASIPAGAIPGDFNFDDVVDFADFSIMASNFNLTFGIVESYEKGDLSRDGVVGLEDFRQLREIFHASAGEATPVPEPAGALAISIAAICLSLTRRSRRCLE